jgi:phage protein D
VIFDGTITNHQLSVSNNPGQSTLTVTGEDVSGMLDLKERSKTYQNTADSKIVSTILGAYPELGLVPDIPQTTQATSDVERITSQQDTDLGIIAKLAKRNSFIFYVEPSRIPTQNKAYFGPMTHNVDKLPPIQVNMGPASNVDEPPQFTFNALGPATPVVFSIDPTTRQPIPALLPSLSRRPLSLRPAPSLREVIDRTSAKLSVADATLRALAISDEASDAITCSGNVDALRYGDLLMARRLVPLLGVGLQYDGLYYVREVTHIIRRGSYKQSFRLSREGHGALPL